MNISKCFKKHIELFFAIIFLMASFYVGKKYEKPFIFVPNQEKSLNVNDSLLLHFNLGLKRLISSTLWIATIIESDHDHYKNKDLNSWMFLRFNSISNLEPLFYENYAFGGPYLSIIKDDLPGASYIYDKGLSHYPDDFSLLRDSGFHYYFEVGDPKKAFSSYSKLRNNPRATTLMITTLARLESGNGDLEDAFHLLMNQYVKINDKESFLAKKIMEFLYAIKAEIDLKCLNQHPGSKECSTKDVEGNDYVLKNGLYQAQRQWTAFKMRQRK